ncbi:MAG: hypothetical protein E7667_00945 [Ruminococcaceae bacterium]|nr:hypothetical protein [Oscillospiraceae bacterium]
MSKDLKKNKKKKAKTVYIDDGSTIADMSGVNGARPRAFGSHPKSNKDFEKNNQTKGSEIYTGNRFKDSLRTYFRSVKLMIIPMLVTMGIIAAAFLIMWILLNLAS